MYQIIQKRKIWLTISAVLFVLSVACLVAWGLNFGIDFTGGSLLEVKFLNSAPSINEVRDSVSNLNLNSLTVQSAEEGGVILRFQETTEEKHQEVLATLKQLAIDVSGPESEGAVDELRFDSVGPSIGQELKTKSLYAVIIALLAIVLYIAWAFSKVSKPVASWKYGIAAIIALFCNIIIVLGVFAFLGRYFNMEINTPFVAAILTVLGYSVNDTIVVFDRIRENLPRSEEDFENTVNTSVNQSLSRSINTSVTTLLVLLSILFFGGATIKDFVLALSIGVFVGTYSSIFLASPILVIWERIARK